MKEKPGFTELYKSLSGFVLSISIDKGRKRIINCINPQMIEFKDSVINDIEGKELSDVKFTNRSLISELLEKTIAEEQSQKQILSTDGSDNKGSYISFKVSNKEIIIIWEAGSTEKLRENKLRLQGAVFERFADSIPEAIFEIDMNGKLTYANANSLSRFGYNKHDLNNGITINDLFRNKQLLKISKNLKDIKSPDQTIHNEYIVNHSDGSQIPVISHIYGIFNTNNKVIGYRGILTDISERLQNRDELFKEKVFLETLINSAPESIVQTTLNGNIERINSEFTSVFGYTAEEAIGKNIDDLIVPEKIISEGKGFTQRASKNETISVETVRRHKNGKQIHVSLLTKPVNIDSETTALFAIYRDISTMKKDRDTKSVIYNISTAALAITEFSDIYTSIRNEIGKIWDNKNFYIVLFNSDSQTLSIPIYSDEKDKIKEIPVKNTLTGWLLKKGEAVLLKEADYQVLVQNKEIHLMGTPCKIWLGVPLIVGNETIGAMVLQDYKNEDAFDNEDLRLLGLIGNQVAMAIQRKNALNNLILERRKAEEAGRLKQQFMAIMSHEIRTPLNEVIGITNLLLQGKPRNDQMEYLKTLRFSSNHLLTLVNDVLDYTKMESGMIIFEKISFSIFDFIEDFRRSYSFRTEEQKLDFRIVISDNIPDILIGDPVRLNQILSNLLTNALKFTKNGYVELGLEKKSRKDNSIELLFYVKDTGIGIAKNKHASIFERFTQASKDTTRLFGGTGLGLSICKKLVELQGGNLLVESEPGKGSKFYFNLPLLIAHEREQTKKKDLTKEKQWDELTNKRVLIAEDNKINFFVANKFLSKWGIIVTHAENGKIALDLIKKNDFDIILMDLHMPEMDGIEATEQIRNSINPKIKDMPVVALTAAVLSEHEDKIEGLDINDYILKPFKPKELYDKILKHCR